MHSLQPPDLYMGRFRYLNRGARPVPSTEGSVPPSLSDYSHVPTLPVTDLRPSLNLGEDSPYKLSVHGFTALRHESALHSAPYSRDSWNDERLLRDVYFPEVQELVQKATGCSKVLVTSAILRSAVYKEGKAAAQAAAETDSAHKQLMFPFIIGNSKAVKTPSLPTVHLDWAPKGARLHIRKFHRQVASAAEKIIDRENQLLESGVEWEDLKDYYHAIDKEGIDNGTGIPRFALFSVWRPLKTVHRDPLAVSPCVSFPKSDYTVTSYRVPRDPKIPANLSRVINSKGDEPEDDGETFRSYGYAAHGPSDDEPNSHDWHFISKQQSSEVLLLQLFDNEMEASARAPQDEADRTPPLGVAGAIHGAFELTDQDMDGEARESIETRCIAFW